MTQGQATPTQVSPERTRAVKGQTPSARAMTTASAASAASRTSALVMKRQTNAKTPALAPDVQLISRALMRVAPRTSAERAHAGPLRSASKSAASETRNPGVVEATTIVTMANAASRTCAKAAMRT